jgi:hypothetical protein
MKSVLAALLWLTAIAGDMPAPKYTESGEMVRPEGYREWMFAGSNLGMGYSDEPKTSQHYHNIFLQREAFEHFKKTGQFPDKTILVMDRFAPGTKESINKHGSFNGAEAGIEVAVKDESRFKDKWAYFVFFKGDGSPLASAPAQPAGRCWACHKANGSVDNVFVQFYPALRDLKPAAK